MKKQKKNEFLMILSQISHSAAENAESLFKLINGETVATEEFDGVIIRNTLLKLEKTYFTPLEREDIFAVMCTLLKLHHSITVLCKKIKITDIFNLSSADRNLISDLISAIKRCDNMVCSLTAIPKCADITENYIEIRKICVETKSKDNNAQLYKEINICLKECYNSAEIIYKSYLKNT